MGKRRGRDGGIKSYLLPCIKGEFNNPNPLTLSSKFPLYNGSGDGGVGSQVTTQTLSLHSTILFLPPPLHSYKIGEGFFDHHIRGEEVEAKMSRRNNGKGHGKLDLKLNLSLPPPPMRGGDTSRRVEADEESSPSSCLSSENEQGGSRSPDSPEATSMVLAACPRCLMYVMLSEEDPKCPRCKRAVLLDFLDGTTNSNNKNSRMI